MSDSKNKGKPGGKGGKPVAKGGAGPMIYVYAPSGELIEKHAAPDMPMRCAFGDSDLGSLYLTTGGGEVYRARDTGRKGVKRHA